MSTKLTTLLDQLQAEDAAAQQQAAMEKDAHRHAMEQQADALLLHALGDYAQELAPLVYERGSEISNQGIVVTWRLGSNDLQLTPTKIEWCERRYNSMSFTVEGIRNQVFQWNDTEDCRTTLLPQWLLAMRTAYPAYKIRLDDLTTQRVAAEADKRSALIANLAWPANWRHTVSADQIQEKYTQLCALGAADLARERLEDYRTDVTEAHQSEQQSRERKAAYEAALADYHRQMETYQQACKAWAEEWQPQLWQPHTLWRVRYTPYHDEASVEPTIEAVCTLDTPEDIILLLKPVAHIDVVDIFGNVTEDFAIATYLDATPLRFVNPPTTNLRERYHRYYPAGDYAVHVPPFILSEPGPAPVRPLAPQRDSDQW